MADDVRRRYGEDSSKRWALPDAVALPRTCEDVVALVRACRVHRMPIVARGRGTNTTGAAIPYAGGVVVSFERMQRILDIRADDREAVVEPGVLNGDLQRALAPHGLFWPPDPASADQCTIGGNLACNAGGPRAVKYGATRDNVLALAAVDRARRTDPRRQQHHQERHRLRPDPLAGRQRRHAGADRRGDAEARAAAAAARQPARVVCRCRQRRAPRWRGSWRNR